MTIGQQQPSDASERLANLLEVMDSTRGHRTTDDLLDRICDVLEADTITLLLLDESEEFLLARASRGLEEEVRQGVRVPIGTGFAGIIAAKRTPLAVSPVGEEAVANPVLWERGVRALLGVPILRDEQTMGVLHVGRMDERPFTDEDTQLLVVAAERVAVAVTAQQLAAETAAAELLERSLLPSRFPAVPGVELAGRYVAAADRLIGGDWYDAFTVPDGRLWLVIGDVVGHGLRSAVVMGRVRSALRAYALLGGGPAEVLEQTDHKVHHFEMGTMTTVLCAVASPPYGTFEICAAGHPAPILARPGEEAELVEVDTNPPLGSVPGLHRTCVTVDVPLGGLLMLYTDGLVERREAPISDGMDRLRQVVRPEHPEVACRTTMLRLVGNSVPDDDIALLAMRHISLPS